MVELMILIALCGVFVSGGLIADHVFPLIKLLDALADRLPMNRK